MPPESDVEPLGLYMSSHHPKIHFTSSNLAMKFIAQCSLSLGLQSTSHCHGQLQPLLWGTVNGQGLIGFALCVTVNRTFRSIMSMT